MVQILSVSAKSPDVAAGGAADAATQAVPTNPNVDSSITSTSTETPKTSVGWGAKLCSFATMPLRFVWSLLTGLVSWVRDAVSYSKISGEMENADLRSLRELLMPLSDKFVSQRRELAPEQLVMWWSNQFDALPQKAQQLLMVEDMKGWALAKLQKHVDEDKITADMVRQHAEALCLDEANQRKSLQFVKELQIATKGTESWNPTENQFVPAYIKAAVAYLDEQLA